MADPTSATASASLCQGRAFKTAALLTLFLLSGSAQVLSQPPAQADILIKGGEVVDGTGGPWVRADVAITPHARYRKAALPTPSEPQSSWTKKRRDVPADGAPGRTFTSRPAPPAFKRLPRTGSHVQQRACSPRPASGRNTRLPEGRPALSGQRTRPEESTQCSMPPSARRQVLLRRT